MIGEHGALRRGFGISLCSSPNSTVLYLILSVHMGPTRTLTNRGGRGTGRAPRRALLFVVYVHHKVGVVARYEI
jgi:hypothetical protein